MSLNKMGIFSLFFKVLIFEVIIVSFVNLALDGYVLDINFVSWYESWNIFWGKYISSRMYHMHSCAYSVTVNMVETNWFVFSCFVTAFDFCTTFYIWSSISMVFFIYLFKCICNCDTIKFYTLVSLLISEWYL